MMSDDERLRQSSHSMAAEVIALMASDHPWIPGAVFIAHPQLRQRVVDVMAASGRFKVRLKPAGDAHRRVSFYARDPGQETWAYLGVLLMRVEEAEVFARLVGMWDE